MIWRDWNTVYPNESQGMTCIRVMRIIISIEQDNRATGGSQDEILLSYPRLAYKGKAVS